MNFERWEPRLPATLRSQPSYRLLTVLAILLIVSISALYPARAEADSALAQQTENPCANPANPVVAENCQTGSDGWMITKPLGDIEGYAYPSSVNKGEKTDLFVNTSAAMFNISIYRSGYYGGKGGRLVQSLSDVKGGAQPGCNRDIETGLASCGNWHSSFSLTVPDTWTSGIYIAKLERPDTGGQSYILFVVRDDARHAAILYQQSLFTYEAYNNYGSKSLYTVSSTGCPTVATTARAVKVSLQRPYSQDQITNSNSFNDYLNVEYPVVRWLEQQGYDVSYSTDMDTHRSGEAGAANELLNHKLFLVVGHDEYWTDEMRKAVQDARDKGVSIGFFSSNVSYWHVRLEADPWTGTPDSVVVTYKTTESGPDDPTGANTSTYRDPARANNPENGLVGIQYIGDNDEQFFPLRVTADEASDQIYRHTALQTMPSGTYINIGTNILGWEWDAVTDNGHTPSGIKVLASSPVYGLRLLDAGNFQNGTSQQSAANITRYTASSGALVYSLGTNQWGWSLGAHGSQPIEADPLIQQITYNMLADMGAQPETPVSAIMLDGQNGVVPVDSERFLKADEQTAPTISSISADGAVGDLMSKGRTVVIHWSTGDVSTMGQVWIGTEAGHTISPLGTDDTSATTHTLTIGGLLPNQTYYYKIVAINQQGQIAESQEGQFQTASNIFAQFGHQVIQTGQSAGCWSQQHPAATAGGGIVFVAGVLVIGVGVVRVRGARRRSAA